MPRHKSFYRTAIFAVAVLYIGSLLSGCVTSRHIDEVKAEIREVKAQNEATLEAVTRMDSVIVDGAEADKKLRNEITYTTSELQQQIETLLENYNDLLQMMEQLRSRPEVTHVLRPSTGSQSETAITPGSEAETKQPPAQPAIDCSAKYDESFILVRRGEYDQAIEGFREFLKHCAEHENAENAYYWIGESYYSQEKFVEAIAEFEYLIDNYKSSVNVSRAIYKAARSNQELGKADIAKKLYQQLIDDYPESLEASQAKDRLRDMK